MVIDIVIYLLCYAPLVYTSLCREASIGQVHAPKSLVLLFDKREEMVRGVGNWQEYRGEIYDWAIEVPHQADMVGRRLGQLLHPSHLPLLGILLGVPYYSVHKSVVAPLRRRFCCLIVPHFLSLFQSGT